MEITLEPETEQWLAEEAQRTGTSPERYAAERLRADRENSRGLPALFGKESELLVRINQGFPTEFWDRYRELIARREARTLSEPERQELIDLSDQIEVRNAERLPLLIALAQMRSQTLAEIIQQLGLRPTHVSP